MHKSGKGYKSITKDVYLSVHSKFSTNVANSGLFATLPRGGHPVKITFRTQRAILKEVRKNLKITAKTSRKPFKLQKSVHVSNNMKQTTAV